MRRARPRASVDRPLLRVAAALCVGSLLGALEIVPPFLSRPATLVALGTLAALALLRRPRDATGQRGVLLWRVRPGSLARCAVYALIVLAAAQRAQAPASDASAAQAAGWLAARGRAGTTLGTWHAERELGGRTLGRIGADAQARLVPTGICADGDLVALLAGAEPRSWPRGPEPGPRAFVAASAAALPAEDDASVVADVESEGPLERPVALVGAADRPAIGVSPDSLVRLAPARPGLVARVVEPLAALRARLLARVSRSEATLARGLVRGLLFGDLSELHAGVGDLFVRTGTFHILAVSGMQVGLVALWIVWPLGSALAALVRLVSARRVDVPVQVFRGVLLFLFVPLAGAEPPVVRAAVAYGIGSLAALVPFARPLAIGPDGGAVRARRRIDTLSLWSLALALECLVHPRAPLSLSVTLSYAATLGLIVATGPVRDLLRAILPGRGRITTVGATGRLRPRAVLVPAQRLLDTALSACAASIAAVLATLPCVWSRFGEWSPVGLVATPLLLVPVASLLGLGLASIALPRGVLDPLLDVAARATVALLELCDRVPASPAVLPPRPALLVSAAVILTIGALTALGRRPVGARTALRLAALAWAALLLPWQPAARTLELWALDVGNGTAVVLRAPGLGTWLFDAGSRDRPDVARQAVAPLLRRLDVGVLGIVLSHEDRDHDGALPWLCDRFPPRVWAGASPQRCIERIPRDTLRLDVATGTLALPSLEGPCSAGGLALSRGSAVEGNEGSRSLAIDWRGERVVLCGDAEEAGLAAWLRLEPPSPALRLLSMPHHGSDTELLGTLLARTRPEEIWISSSTPPAVARELDRRELDWSWTARDGPLHLELPDAERHVAEVARSR